MLEIVKSFTGRPHSIILRGRTLQTSCSRTLNRNAITVGSARCWTHNDRVQEDFRIAESFLVAEN